MFHGKWMKICSLLCVFFLVVELFNFPRAQAADPWVNKADVSWIDSSKKLVAFTFDDGPVGTAPTASSQRIMDVLERYGMHCTYFYWGEKINDSNIDEIKRAYSIGCELGNHSFTHPYLTQMNASQIQEEISKTNAWLEPISGNAVTLVRPPYGSTNNTVQQAAGAPLINWSLDSGDWNNGNYDSVLRTVCNGIQDGSIILFHQTYDFTAQAIETLVPELIEQGYEIVSVSELMKMKGIELKAGTVYTNQAVGKPNVIENADHEHVYQDIVTAPTCTERGYMTHKCTVEGCKKVVVDTYVDALGHDWDEGKITTPATEQSAGLTTYTCARCGEIKTKRIPRIGATVPDDIDFTDPASADRFEIVNKDVTAIREGEGLYMITTKNAFEPCNDQLSGDAATTPKDLVLVPVEGDWQATLKFNFSTGSASNGYYQFFGFYAMADYNNCVGIRGGDGAFQNFLRVGGELAADTADLNSTPGFSAAGTYWFRVRKEGTTYTCYRSSDGEDFTEIFSYDDTGIEADKLAIDAYTGMTEGYIFMVDSLTFEDVHVHNYVADVTAPTCTEGGYTVYTCACGSRYVADEVPALGHDFVNGKCSRCDEKDPDYVCNGGDDCPAKDFTDSPKLGTWAHEGVDYCIEKGYMNGISDAIFKPNGTVTRGQLVTILYRIAKEPDISTEKSFTDVVPDRYYTDAVLWAAENDIVNGYNDGTFKPESPISREQIPTILYRYAGSPVASGTLDFPDADKTGSYAKDALIWATQEGLITGVKTTEATLLNPKANATRAQIATIIMRYLESL